MTSKQLGGLMLAIGVGISVALCHPLIIWLYLGAPVEGIENDWQFWFLDLALGILLAGANAVIGFNFGLREEPAVPAILYLCCVPPLATFFAEPIVGILGLYVFLAGRIGYGLGLRYVSKGPSALAQ